VKRHAEATFGSKRRLVLVAEVQPGDEDSRPISLHTDTNYINTTMMTMSMTIKSVL